MKTLIVTFIALLISCNHSEVQSDPNTPVIVLERGGWYGPHRKYTVKIFGDGRVEYLLRETTLGAYTAWNTSISQADLQTLIDAFDNADFLEINRESVLEPNVDAATSLLVFNWNGKSNSVYYGDGARSLESIANEVDRIANTPTAQAALEIEKGKVQDELMKYSNFSTGIVKMDRLACDSNCPEYSVSIRNDGRVLYEGVSFVRELGRRESRIDPNEARSLFISLLCARFMSLADCTLAPDFETTNIRQSRLSLTLDSATRSLTVLDTVQGKFARFPNLVDGMVNIGQWINE